MLMETSTSELK